MIAHEDRFGKAMTQEQIVESLAFRDFNTEVLLFELMELSYVYCSVGMLPRKEKGNFSVTTLCYAWGTTFFGNGFREWRRRPTRSEVKARAIGRA